MTRYSITRDEAAAWGVRLALVDYIPAFPLTPQNKIIEILANWISQGEMSSKLSILESEQAMLKAAGTAATQGERVFGALSDKNLLRTMELLYNICDWHAPLVLINIAQTISENIMGNPCDNTLMATRDSGILQIHCANRQEILDSVLLAHRLSEDNDVHLPVLIFEDSQDSPSAREWVDIPNTTAAKQFIGSYDPGYSTGRAQTISAYGQTSTDITAEGHERYKLHLASQQSLSVYDELADEFRDFFGRYHPAVVDYCCSDAEFIFVITGSVTATAEQAVNSLRDNGWKVGIVRLRLLRPFPQDKLLNLLRGKRAVAVLDSHISPGGGGVLSTELAAALYGHADTPSIIASFIIAHRLTNISTQDFFDMASLLRKAADSGEIPTPQPLLMRQTSGEIKYL